MIENLKKKELITFICLVIIICGFIGWGVEVIFYYIDSGFKTIYWRGGNFLPWINIYAWGALLMITLAYKNREHPLHVFLISMASAGLLELLSGYFLYGVLGWTKSWDYSQEVLSGFTIGGYVSMRSLVGFGIGGLFLIYILTPLLVKLVTSKYKDKIFVISIILVSIIMIDELYNLIFAYMMHTPRARDIYRPLGFKYLYFS
ncbi:MAG: putative ABC transporter permease [Bacilli bacterium]|nr:putative ABC transporter permease [Bacilli bacterium]